MVERVFEVFNAFTRTNEGGSGAAMVADAADLTPETMQSIANRIGMPATCFITRMGEADLDVRFFSTQAEYGMCGHGTIAMTTWLIEREDYACEQDQPLMLNLHTPEKSAVIRAARLADGRISVLLDLDVAEVQPFDIGRAELATALGMGSDGIARSPSVDLTVSDFRSLMVPARDLAAMQGMQPYFAALADLSARFRLDTIAVFSMETEAADSDVHVREFAPILGTDESAATGTTNRALACYLYHHRLVAPDDSGHCTVLVEQGYEMGRPSQITTAFQVENGQITQISVGGIATRRTTAAPVTLG